jgi:hypothetical protein
MSRGVHPGDLVVVQTPESRFGQPELRLMRVLTARGRLPRTLGHVTAQAGDRGVPFGKMACERLWRVQTSPDTTPDREVEYVRAHLEARRGRLPTPEYSNRGCFVVLRHAPDELWLQDVPFEGRN